MKHSNIEKIYDYNIISNHTSLIQRFSSMPILSFYISSVQQNKKLGEMFACNIVYIRILRGNHVTIQVMLSLIRYINENLLFGNDMLVFISFRFFINVGKCNFYYVTKIYITCYIFCRKYGKI